MTEHPVYPVWIFKRGAEVDDNSALWFNNFDRPCLKRRQRLEVERVLARVRYAIRDGRLPLGRAIVGWPGVAGARPLHAVDTSDRAAMKPWFARTYCVVMTPDEMADPAAVSALIMKGRHHG